MSSPPDPPRLAAMREFVSAVMTGRPLGTPPPTDLVAKAHLGPLAFRMGMQVFRAEYAASAIMAERRAAVLAQVTTHLRDIGVPVALIKGIAYAGTVYADHAERPMQDIDLLVRRADLPAALRCLSGLGFGRVGMARKLSGYHHAIALVRDDAMVELHRSIVQHHRTRLRIGDVWRRARFDGDTGAHRLDPVDELLFCVLHIARSELAVPAINYVDVHRLWTSLDEAGRVVLRTRAAAARVVRALDAVLAMTELLRAGRRGRPGGRVVAVLPASDDVLTGERPRRLRQIAQKALLTEGPVEFFGLGLAYARATLDSYRRRRGRRRWPGLPACRVGSRARGNRSARLPGG
jgi:hypothetical protein